MSYRVIAYFTDLQDNNYAYHTGDKFPRDGKEVEPSRIAELSGSDNRRKKPLIEACDDESVKAEPKKEAKTEPKKRGRKKVTDNGNGIN